jgi:D-alanyl-D-alanine dipeptidase
VDLTLAGPDGADGVAAAGDGQPLHQVKPGHQPNPFHQLNLGSPIDAIGAVSEPDHFAAAALADPSSGAARWHGRRQLLREVMATAGFAQHPNEWWHFSLGDQLWAWRSGAATARYGRWLGSSDC